MRRNTMQYLTVALGLILLVFGLFLVKAIVNPQGIMRAVPYIFIGLGCGIFGHGMGELISRRTIKKYPDVEKQMRIAKEDERNIAIVNRAKAKAHDLMIFIFGALIITFALMGIDMVAILLLVFAYLFIVGCYIYYQNKFDKEM